MIKEVLVYTYGNQTHDSTIRAAASFAANYKASLTGLFVKPDVIGYTAAYGSYPLNLAETFNDIQKEYAERIKARFESITSEFDIRSVWHQTDQYEKNPKPAFYADVIFVNQPNRENSVIFNDTDFVDRLITDTGLPTIVIPNDWSAERFAQSPVLGWKETREAISAVRYALPIMRKAIDVDIVNIARSTDLDAELIDGIEICNYLNKHKVKTKYFTEALLPQDHGEAEALLRHVENQDRDLVIIGGYSHSRFREIILGGVTRTLLKKSPVPVLLAH